MPAIIDLCNKVKMIFKTLKHFIFIFLVVISIVLLFWTILPGGWSEQGASDYRSFYKPVALNLLAGKGLVTNNGDPAVRYPPGFPLILAGLFGLSEWTGTPKHWWLQGFTLLAIGLTCVFLYGLVLMVLGERIALITAILWMTYFANLWLTKQPNSEIAFLPVFYGALLLFGGMLWRGWTSPWVSLSVGALIGFASLIRPIAILLGILLAGLLIALRWKNDWKRYTMLTMFLLIGNIIVVMPWELWAWSRTGRWIPLSTGGAVSVRDGLTCALVTKGYRRPLKVPSAMQEVVIRAVKEWREGRLETIDDILAFLKGQMKENPLGVLQLFWWKMKRAWYGTDAQRSEEKWILVIQVPYLLLALIGSLILWYKGSKYREWLFLTLLVVIYFLGMTIMVLSILRYMVPAMGLLFPSIASLLDYTLNKFRLVKVQQCTEVKMT